MAGNDVRGRSVRHGEGTRTGSTLLGFSRGSELNTDIGEFAVVGGAVGVDVHEVQRVGIQVVASLLRNGRSTVEGLDEREVIDRHVGQTLGVLVVDRDLGESIGGGSGVERDTSGRGDRRGRRVVGPLGFVGRVLESKEESLDRVREMNVDAGRVAGAVHGLRVVGLDLLDEEITRSLTHEFAFVVGDEGVLGPDLNVGESHVGVGQIGRRGIGRHTTRASPARDGSDIVDDQEIGPVTEVEAEFHLVVRKSGRGESDTRVTSVAIRERQHERGCRNDQTVVGGTDGVGVVVQERDVANHVLVADTLGGRDRESRPEVQEVVIETHLDQVVKGDGGLLEQVVHEVPSPTHTGIGTETSGSGVNRDGGERDTEPVKEQVITGTGDVGIPLNTELGRLVQGESGGNDGEPSGFGDTTDKVRDGFGAAIHVFLGFVIGG